MALEIEPQPGGGASLGEVSTRSPGAAGQPRGAGSANSIVIGLINNMPDSALEGTETQFNALLRVASGPLRVRLRYSSLPEVARGPAARARIEERYWALPDLLQRPLDALIVTGTEPRAGSLRAEPYWNRLVEILEFADAHTVSSIWSCLAAHAAVLHFDGIERRRRPQKLCGVYDHTILGGHPLTAGLVAPLRTPQSRWNELPLDTLVDAGYTIISQSPETGADSFVKAGRSLRVFFQGHPEYEDRTLLKEYQRDVGRFVSGQQNHYPTLPVGYFGVEARALLSEYEQQVVAGRRAEPLTAFPFTTVAASLVNSWSVPAARMYANWLNFVVSRKEGAREPARHAV
jgi:homoserine O-succinyltransferase